MRFFSSCALRDGGNSFRGPFRLAQRFIPAAADADSTERSITISSDERLTGQQGDSSVGRAANGKSAVLTAVNGASTR